MGCPQEQCASQPAQPASTRTTDQQHDPQAQAETISKCTIPFGHPPQTITIRISENHRTNVKAMPCPAKRNLLLARAGGNGARSTRQRTPLRVRDSVLPSCPDEPPRALTITTALAIQRLPLPAKRNGAWVARQSSALRNPHDPQKQGQPINRATRKRKQKRTANAPFRFATLPFRKLINEQCTMCNVQNGKQDFIKLTDTNPVSPSILN